MKNKKGANGVGVALVVMLGIMLVLMLVGGFWIATGGLSQSTVGGSTGEELNTAVSTGDVAQVKVYVRDLASNNVNDKLAVATYCQADDGAFIIDGTTSSASAEISGSTTRGKTVTCWAFSSTVQTKTAAIVTVDEEVEHVVIDAYTVATNGEMTFYDDQFNTANGGLSNVTIAADGSDSLSKMRFKNNNSDKILPLAGFYFNTPASTNISALDLSGSATLSGMDHSATRLIESDLSTKITARKDNWDYVFEIDDDASASGNQVLMLEENDYLETGAVVVESDVGCDAVAANLVTGYAFTKGYYRATKDQSVAYGHETDASSASAITADITGSNFYCDN
ncbi:hypothetical protein M0R04_09885 [Candidatus Dojkabacteria bacterium]|jgi:hypothetical protein|nr:hypothetical protein [Candidatus Dojkabacteria bacterium]